LLLDSFLGLSCALAYCISSALAIEVSTPIPRFPKALPQAEVSQFSTKDVLLI